MNCSSPGSSVHGLLQARILEWGAIPFSRDRTRVSHIAGRFFTNWTTREAQKAAIFQFRKKEFTAYKTWRTRTYTGNQPCSINMGRDPWMWPPRWSWGSWALGGDWSHLLWLPSGPALSSCFHAVSSKHLQFFQLVSQHRNLKWWGALIPRTRFQDPLLPVQCSSHFSPSHASSGGYVLRRVWQVMEMSDKVGCAAREQGWTVVKWPNSSGSGGWCLRKYQLLVQKTGPQDATFRGLSREAMNPDFLEHWFLNVIYDPKLLPTSCRSSLSCVASVAWSIKAGKKAH